MPNLTFELHQKAFAITHGTDLLKACQINPAIPLKFGCQQGECGVCAIRIKGGVENLSRKTKQETKTLEAKHFDEKTRLACQCALLGDVIIE